MKQIINELKALGYTILQLNDITSICKTDADGYKTEVGRLVHDQSTDEVRYIPSNNVVKNASDVVKEIEDASNYPVSIVSRITGSIGQDIVRKYGKSINVSSLVPKVNEEEVDGVYFSIGSKIVSSKPTLESMISVANMRTIELLKCALVGFPLLKDGFKDAEVDLIKDYNVTVTDLKDHLIETLEKLLQDLKK